MQVNYLIAGLYGEEAGRHIFETMCGLLVLNEENKLDLDLTIQKGFDEKHFSSIKVGEEFENLNLKMGGDVFHIQTRKGDGGLDILVEDENYWTVYQCKFFVEGKLTTLKEKGDGDYKKSERIKQIIKSFDKAVESATSQEKILKKWVLCIPKDLDDLEKKWFNDFKEINKERCRNIIFIGNLNLNSWLIENEKIYKHFFFRINKEDEIKGDLEVSVYEKIKEYNSLLDVGIFNAQNSAARYCSKMSDYENLSLLFKHIIDFRGEFKKISDLLKKIDNISNENKRYYEEYTKEKKWMSTRERDSAAILIERKEASLTKLTERQEIIDFQEYLNNVQKNLSKYFSKEEL